MGISADDARRALPYPVGVALRRDGAGDVPPLEPVEQAVLGPHATQRRRRLFALGRTAARDALREIGVPTAGIGRGPDGEPLWPAGVVGTISHTGDLAIALVGRTTDYAGLGLDVEQLVPGLSARGSRLVCTPAELAWLALGPGYWRTMLFSAKEALFKALFPIERVWLGFNDAELTWRADESAFEARLLKGAGVAYPIGSVLRIACTVTDLEVLSATYAPARP